MGQHSQQPPELTWRHPQPELITGYQLQLHTASHTYPLTSELLTSPHYQDIGYHRQSREYSLVAEDKHQRQSPAYRIHLPQVAITSQSQFIERGLIHPLHYRLSNLSEQDLTGLQLNLDIGKHHHQAKPINLKAGAEGQVDIVVGGYHDLVDPTELTLTLTFSHQQTDLRFIEHQEIAVKDASLAWQIQPRSALRGGVAKVSFSLHNITSLPLEIITAKESNDFEHLAKDVEKIFRDDNSISFDNPQPGDVHFRVYDEEDNLLSRHDHMQYKGEGVIAVKPGYAIIRIPAGERYQSAPIDVPIPESAPDQVRLSGELSTLNYHVGEGDQVSIQGYQSDYPLTLFDAPYYATLNPITPQQSLGFEDILITGSTLHQKTHQAKANVDVKLIIQVNDIEKTFTATSDNAGNFTHLFRPFAKASGRYHVSAIHPELNLRPQQAIFQVDRFYISPSQLDTYLPKNYPVDISLQLIANSASVDNIRLEAKDLPKGIHITVPDALTHLEQHRTATLTLQLWADNDAEASGKLNLSLHGSMNEKTVILNQIPVDYQVLASGPSIAYRPSMIETGVAPGGSVTAQLTLLNQGAHALRKGKLTLTDSEGKPAEWVYLNIATEQLRLAIGESLKIPLQFSPPETIPPAVYEYQLTLSSANSPTEKIPVFVVVDDTGKGNLQFKVADIYTGTLDKQGKLIEGLDKATVHLQHKLLTNLERQVETDELGEVLFHDLPEGHYRYRISAPGHEALSDTLWVRPGITVNQDILLNKPLVSVEWKVREITLTDQYEIVLDLTYETDSPAPVVVAEALHTIVPDLKKGDVFYGEFSLSNYGLVRADQLKLSRNQPTSVEIELLDTVPSKITPHDRWVIPYRITALQDTPEGANGNGACCRELKYKWTCHNGAISKAKVPALCLSNVSCEIPTAPPQRGGPSEANELPPPPEGRCLVCERIAAGKQKAQSK